MILDLAPLRWNSTLDWYSEFQKEEDGYILVEYKLPGISKEEIELAYNETNNFITIFVKNKLDKSIYLYKPIDSERAEAELELGVLKIRAPIKDSNKIIRIK